MELWESIKKVFASSKPPQPGTIPNQLFSYYNQQKNVKYKSVLPKEPNIQQIRNFAKNPVVRRPITLIEDYVTRLPYKIVPKDPNDKKSYKKQITTIKNVIDNPNTLHKKRMFDRMLLEDILTFDCGVVEKAKSRDTKRPLFLYPTDGTTIQFIVPYDYNDVNALRYSQTQPYTNSPKYFTNDQLAYIQKNVFSDRPYGLSPVMQAYQYILYYIGALERANDVASNSTADFAIHLKGADENKAKAFREYMENEIQGTGTIPVSYGNDGSDLQTHQIRAINKDGLFLDWQNMLIMVCGMSFNCPREKMGIVSSSDKFTAPDLDNIMLQEMIKPYADLMEDFYNEEVLSVMGYGDILKYEYIYEDSLADKQKKATIVTGLYQNDILTRKSAQEQLGMVDENDEYSDMYVGEYKNSLNMDLQENQAKNSGSGGVGGFNGQGDVKDTTE